MSALKLVFLMLFSPFHFLTTTFSKMGSPANKYTSGYNDIHTVVTDLTINFCSSTNPSTCVLDPQKWHRIKRDLYLHTAEQSAWLQIAQAKEKELTADDLVVTAIRVGELDPGTDTGSLWESRPGGIWVLRTKYTGNIHQTVTGVDVLFGLDAIDPRLQWALMQQPLQLSAEAKVPVARLTVRHGRAKPRSDDSRPALRVKEDGKFKIVQISDTHMVTGVGVCKDSIDKDGLPLPESEADPLTVKFMGEILDFEKPDLVILTGDQLHHDILDSQSTLFKVFAPLIARSIPYAAVFGNHDDEGSYALSRTAQMALLQDLPFSLCQPGPEDVDGVGNYYLQIFAHESPKLPVSTLYLLDSHGQVPSEVHDPDYGFITQAQIDWFTSTSQALRKARDEDHNNYSHLSLAFMHIPFPEYADSDLMIKGGKRREPTEGPSFNSHFYDALVKEGIAAVGCGHDHVNDFCALLPQEKRKDLQENDNVAVQPGPWLCYNGGVGFGGYCSYGKNRYHRRTRVWELDANSGELKTWKRLEYAKENVDELVLVENGKVAGSSDNTKGSISGSQILVYDVD